LLVTVARQLERCVRSGDTVARLGGDEFALLSEDLAHTDDAVLLAERVLRDLAISLNVAGRQVSVSASVGVVVSDQHHVSDVLDIADAAMYRAKAAGKARYHLADKPTRKR
jgi:diguanylate cyclase (GGDEF)-like protein